jgi:hypothetical protein
MNSDIQYDRVELISDIRDAMLANITRDHMVGIIPALVARNERSVDDYADFYTLPDDEYDDLIGNLLYDDLTDLSDDALLDEYQKVDGDGYEAQFDTEPDGFANDSDYWNWKEN